MSKQNTSRPHKGLYQDASPLDQPTNTYTMAWNAITETSDGNNNFISNEESNSICGQLPSGYRPIGDVYIGDENTVIFSTNGTDSEIGVLDIDCNYTTHVNNVCLNFQITNQVDAVFRVRRGCERTIYFTDGLNEVRYFNLDKPEEFKDNVGEWDCSLFDVFLKLSNPCFKSFELTEQGSLLPGTYSFAIQYLDKDLNPTKWTFMTLPLPIFRASITTTYSRITGTSDIDTDSIGGSGPTTKAIRVNLEDLDLTYSFFRFAAVEHTSFNGQITRVLLSSEIPTRQDYFVHDGNLNNYTEININELRIQPTSISSAEHIEQLENRLILAKLNGKQENFCAFQPFASQISSRYVVKTAPAKEIGEGNSKDPDTYWNAKGYMGDEIYAFGIVYVFDDGFESPAYHIPGTNDEYGCGEIPCVAVPSTLNCIYVLEGGAPDLVPGYCDGTPTSYRINYSVGGVPTFVDISIPTEITMPTYREIFCGVDAVITAVSITNISFNSCYAYIDPNNFVVTSNFVTSICPKTPIETWEQNIGHIIASADQVAYNALPSNEKLERWRVYNTATPIDNNSGYMAYWESLNANYLSLLDCEGGDYWGVDCCGNPLLGQPIRHHKFPDRNLIRLVEAAGQGISYESQLILEIEYTGTPAELAALLQPPGDPNPSETLIIDYDLDGVPQTAITITLYNSDFVDDGFGVFPPIARSIVTRTGTTTQGIDNLVFTGGFGVDATTTFNTIITDISTINGEQVAPNDILTTNILGIKFDNIVYPSPNIVGHYIVRGDRDAFNRTVIDKGISNSIHEASAKGVNWGAFTYFAGGNADTGGTIYNQSANYNYLLTPNIMFLNDVIRGSYIKQEHQFKHAFTRMAGNKSNPLEFDDLTEFGAGTGNDATIGTGVATLIDTRHQTYAGMVDVTPGTKIRKIEKSVMMYGTHMDDGFIGGRRLVNTSFTNKVQVMWLPAEMNSAGTANIPYVSVKVDRDIHPVLFGIKYYRTHNCVLKNNEDNTIFGGDIFVAPMDLSNTLFFQFNDSAWDTVLYVNIAIIAVVATVLTAGAASVALAAAIGAITGITIAATTLQTVIVVGAILAGAILVTVETVEQVIQSYRKEGLQEVVALDQQFQDISYSTKNFMEYANEFLENIYVESTLNLGLRQDHTIYFPGQFRKDHMDIQAFMRDRIMTPVEGENNKKDRWAHRGNVIPEVYHYNLDYSAINRDNVYTPLSESYDCCSNCLEKFPTRILYSEQSFQEESVDNYRVFLVNNYRDIEAERGEITNIFRKHNNLFIHTEEALWQLPQNIQERITGELLSFLGTGEYFSIPPRLILDDEIGSAGSRHKWATIKTDIGTFFLDESNREIYMLATGSGPQAISNNGMRTFFKTNLVPNLSNQFKQLTAVDFTHDNNPANPNGVGYHSVYDTRHKRIVFTKRDYKILSQFTGSFTQFTSVLGVITGVVLDQLFYDRTTQQFGIGTGVDTFNYVTLEDPLYFENKSWTISYSLLSQSWTSFHSYLPLHYYYIHNSFYSFMDNVVWKHNMQGNYQNFYGVRYAHVLEYISLSSPVLTRLWDEVMLQTMARIYNATLDEFHDERFVTFNKAIFSNSKQCSGLLNLVVKDNEDANYFLNQIKNIAGNQIKIDRNERNWTLNEIRDYRIDYDNPIWSKQWSSVQSEFPIDKVLNASTIDFNKLWSDLQSLRDKYLVIRLIFDNFDNVNLITNYSFERETNSLR